MATTVASGLAVKCPNCAASLELPPDTVIYVCRYCGWSGFVTNERIDASGILPLERGITDSTVEAFLKKRTGGPYSISGKKFIMAPFWVIAAHGRTRYNGYKKETRSRTVGSGKDEHTETYAVYRPVNGVIEEDLVLTLFAHRYEMAFGLEKAEEAVRRSAPTTLSEDELKNLAKTCEFLSSSIGPDEARHWAATKINDIHRVRAEGMCTKLFGCFTDVSVLSSKLLFYPLYNVRYESGGRTFRVLFDGAKGSLLEAEVPVSRGQRGEFLIGAYSLSAVLAGASYEVGCAVAVANTTRVGLYVSEVIAVVAFGIAAFLALIATRSQEKVEER